MVETFPQVRLAFRHFNSLKKNSIISIFHQALKIHLFLLVTMWAVWTLYCVFPWSVWTHSRSFNRSLQWEIPSLTDALCNLSGCFTGHTLGQAVHQVLYSLRTNIVWPTLLSGGDWCRTDAVYWRFTALFIQFYSSMNEQIRRFAKKRLRLIWIMIYISRKWA